MEWGRIFKAGAVSGVVYGILQGIVAVLSYVFYRDDIKALIQSSIPSNVNIPISVDQLVDIGMMFAIPGSVIGGIIAGIIVAFIFSIMYKELLGKNSKIKGVFLCVLLAIAIVLGELAYPGMLGIFMVQTRYIMLAPLSLIFFLVFGYILGIFYDKFEEKK